MLIGINGGYFPAICRVCFRLLFRIRTVIHLAYCQLMCCCFIKIELLGLIFLVVILRMSSYVFFIPFYLLFTIFVFFCFTRVTISKLDLRLPSITASTENNVDLFQRIYLNYLIMKLLIMDSQISKIRKKREPITPIIKSYGSKLPNFTRANINWL